MNTQNEETIIEELREIKGLLKSFGDFLPLVSKVINLRLETLERQAVLMDGHLFIINENLAAMPGSLGEHISPDTIYNPENIK